MSVNWFPGGRRNKDFEVERGEMAGGYEFSLCRADTRFPDEFKFRLFVYRAENAGGGFLHVGGFNTIDDAKLAAENWTDPYPIAGGSH